MQFIAGAKKSSMKGQTEHPGIGISKKKKTHRKKNSMKV
jgi:hypothetical protein